MIGNTKINTSRAYIDSALKRFKLLDIGENLPKRNVSIDFEKFVEIFNNDGKPTAKKYMEDTYNITYNIAQRRLVKETNYVFSRTTKKYIVQNKTEEVFISTDKLFEGKFISKDKQSTLNDKSISFDDILTDILKDRLTELGKFFNISQSSKEISIYLTIYSSYTDSSYHRKDNNFNHK